VKGDTTISALILTKKNSRAILLFYCVGGVYRPTTTPPTSTISRLVFSPTGQPKKRLNNNNNNRIMKSYPSPVTSVHSIHPQMVMHKLTPVNLDVKKYVGAMGDSISQLCLLVNDSASGKSFLDCYDMGAVLGEGGFALVYRCKHKDNDQDYAVKEVIDANYATDGENLKEELDALKRLREGPYVVRLFDVFREYDRTFVVMEEMKGGDLLERITEKETFPDKEARRISRTLLEAIGFCHRKHVAHRDIKPENILLVSPTDDTSIKLADFGCARYLLAKDDDDNMVRMTTLCGSPQYVAPELYTNDDGYDERCDLWSAGIVIYVILGGYAPFEAPTLELPALITEGYVEFHPRYWGDVAKPPKELIESLLQVDPDDRATIAEALDSEWLKRRDKEFMNESNGNFGTWLKRSSGITQNSITSFHLSFNNLSSADDSAGAELYAAVSSELKEETEEDVASEAGTANASLGSLVDDFEKDNEEEEEDSKIVAPEPSDDLQKDADNENDDDAKSAQVDDNSAASLVL
jgi:calcium/calmodulin-dependent protein kinase I